MIVREREAVKITRIFDFSRETVFKMWIDPKNVAKWWGAEGDVTASCEVDPRPGGAFNVDIRLPSGTILPMTGSFTKIVAPELLVFRTAAPNSGIGSDRLLLLGSSWEALNTVTFEELGPKRTQVTVAVNVLTVAPEELEPLERGFKGGWAQSLNKLQEALNSSPDGERKSAWTANEQDTVKITRVFDFPRVTVFRMWTDPRKLAEWWGPKGSVTLLSEVDPRPGGAIRVDQRNPDGAIYSFNATLEKITPPELIVYRHASPSTAGFSPWEDLQTITFEELGPRRTRVNVVTRVIAGPQEERESLMGAFRNGWGQSLEKLQGALN